MMNNDDYRHLEPPLQQIVRSQVRTKIPTKLKISTSEEYSAQVPTIVHFYASIDTIQGTTK
jgi:hypothetical protein